MRESTGIHLNQPIHVVTWQGRDSRMRVDVHPMLRRQRAFPVSQLEDRTDQIWRQHFDDVEIVGRALESIQGRHDEATRAVKNDWTGAEQRLRGNEFVEFLQESSPRFVDLIKRHGDSQRSSWSEDSNVVQATV